MPWSHKEVQISVSSAPIAKLGNKRYYDLLGTLEVMKKVYRESIVDGFELQLQPEWDSENPPLTDTQFADWTKTRKFNIAEILTVLEKQELPILSVHTSRDIGRSKRLWKTFPLTGKGTHPFRWLSNLTM
jgi:hypothetical protein